MQRSELAPFTFADDWHRIVFVNGRYDASLSHLTGLPDGVRVLPLAQAYDELPILVEQHLLALERHDVGDDPPAGHERIPAAIKDARNREPAADEHRIRTRKAVEGFRRAATDDAQRRDPEAQRVGLDTLGPVVTCLDCDCSGGWLGAHPLDRNRPAAGPDVPQQRTGHRAKRGDGGGAYVTLRQLTIGLEGIVGQTGDKRVQWRPGRGAALDRDRVQRVDCGVAPGLGSALGDVLDLVPELLEDDEAARSEATVAQHIGDLARAGAARGVDDETAPRLQQARDDLGSPRDAADQLDLGSGPIESSAGEREGGDVGMHDEPPGRQATGERGADAMQHRVAAG